MANRNQNIGVLTPKKYLHDLSHHHTLTLDWFRIQPIDCIECVEGDKMSINLSTILDAAPLATKVFGGASLDIHAFFVPSRIVWEDFNEYRYGDSREYGTDVVPPFMTMGDLSSLTGGSKLTHDGDRFTMTNPNNQASYKNLRRVMSGLGYPTSFIQNDNKNEGNISLSTTYNNMPISLLPMRVYERVWWDWYRDSVNIPESGKSRYCITSSGAIGTIEKTISFKPRFRCWRKDYITTLLQSPQLGESTSIKSNVRPDLEVHTVMDGSYIPMGLGQSSSQANVEFVGLQDAMTQSSDMLTFNLTSNLQVNALRGAIAMQRFLEKLNVTGTRPIERIQALFGQSPSPVRLDMSELIGTHRQRVYINGLTNTGSSNLLNSVDSAPDDYYNDTAFGVNPFDVKFGQVTGRSYSEGNTPNINYTCSEDGFILICASLMPDYINPTAVSRMFMRGLSTPDASNTDYYTPEFDGIGYQECLYNEVSFPEYTPSNEGVWGVDYDPYKVAGYQPKYEEYRFMQDRISGDFNEQQSSVALRNYVFAKNLTDGMQSGILPSGVTLTTPDENDVALFDNHFQKTNPALDHFIFDVHININALRPISKTELPTELSNLANSVATDVSNGGVRL